MNRVISALSEVELGTQWPAFFIDKEIMPYLNSSTKKMLKMASWIINFSPIISRFKTFSMMNNEEKKKWLSSIKGESFTYDMINLLEFFLGAVYYVNQENAIKINYRREPYVSPSHEIASSPALSIPLKVLNKKYDVIIVGSGAGGAVAAWNFARKGYNVAIFEVGPEPTREEFLNEHPVYRALKYYWNNGMTFTWGSPIIDVPFGRVLGGTVTLNSGTIFRIPDEVLLNWRKETGANIKNEELNLAYEVIESKLNVKAIPRHLLGNNALVMMKGAEKLGLNHYPVRRPLGNCHGMGECAFGCPYNGKLDMRLTFLKEAIEHGASVFTSSEVKKIIINNGKAQGVLVNINNTHVIVEAKVIIVSAGAVNTPKLLRISGIKNDNIGKHLHIHPAAGVTAIMDYRVEGWRGTMQSYCVDNLLREFHTLLLATFPPPGIGYSAGSLSFSELDKYPFLASIGVQTSDDSEGNIFGRRITGIATYNVKERDIEKIKEGIILSSEILFAAGAVKIFLPIKKLSGISNMLSIKNVLKNAKPKAFKLSAYHPMSTARIGGDQDIGVVDLNGKVYGYSNLHIADASVLPSTTYVNPQLTINALSLLISEKIIKEI
ncbi:MAG: GMC family oxidoreductase N-terminal domain-containing protein [Thermoprotei archaeon]